MCMHVQCVSMKCVSLNAHIRCCMCMYACTCTCTCYMHRRCASLAVTLRRNGSTCCARSRCRRAPHLRACSERVYTMHKTACTYDLHHDATCHQSHIKTQLTFPAGPAAAGLPGGGRPRHSGVGEAARRHGPGPGVRAVRLLSTEFGMIRLILAVPEHPEDAG